MCGLECNLSIIDDAMEYRHGCLHACIQAAEGHFE